MLRALLALAVLASAAHGGHIRLMGHSVVYLPETDAVRFRATFNEPPVFPGMYLSFDVYDLDASRHRVGGLSLRDQGVLGVIWNGQHGPIDLSFPYTVNGNLFEATIPFADLHVDRHEFNYSVTFQNERLPEAIQSRLGTAQIGVPEPSSVTLAATAFALFGIKAHRAIRRRTARPPARVGCAPRSVKIRPRVRQASA